MICVVIKGPSLEEAKVQIRAALEVADLVELCLDFFVTLDIRALKEQFTIPMIFRLRNHPERLDAIRRLAKLKPQYLDLESNDPPSFIQEIAASHPEIKIILSHHDFEKTPDLDAIYNKMQGLPAFFYKTAVTAKNSLDAMRLLSWAKEKQQNNLIVISMGPYGQLSRILAPLIGSPLTYAMIAEGQESAPGQLPAKILIERYHYRSLSPKTALYGLIGDPVDRSISDISHNQIFNAYDLDAIYIKIPIKPEELSEFLEWAKKIDMKGLSVTMPLKEAILPFLDAIDAEAQKIGAVNTLRFDQGKISGCNTDGIGALNALEKTISVKDKQVVILGAGGAAKAIAYEAKKRGALLTLVNRDLEKAERLAGQLDCAALGLDQMHLCAQRGYDILINTTPLSLPIDPVHILKGSYVMDIKTRPQETLLLKHAKEKGCIIIYGYEMFVEQALGQYSYWFKNKISQDLARNTLTTTAQTLLT